mmetsp:Transcript_2538/g.6359  ORF Transcript_2538/g.6359 Transcript_2538/m.6359 type:complete len:224 (+) Transcript_2538:126-797(+)
MRSRWRWLMDSVMSTRASAPSSTRNCATAPFRRAFASAALARSGEGSFSSLGSSRPNVQTGPTSDNSAMRHLLRCWSLFDCRPRNCSVPRRDGSARHALQSCSCRSLLESSRMSSRSRERASTNACNGPAAASELEEHSGPCLAGTGVGSAGPGRLSSGGFPTAPGTLPESRCNWEAAGPLPRSGIAAPYAATSAAETSVESARGVRADASSSSIATGGSLRT